MDEEEFNLNSLIVDEDEVQTANVIQLSLFIYDIVFLKKQENLDEILSECHRVLQEIYPFRQIKGKNMREGFLHFNDIDEENKKLVCFYAKESPSKVRYADKQFTIKDVRLRSITPSYTVKIIGTLFPERLNLIIYGGNESLVMRVLELVRHSIRGRVTEGFRDTEPIMSQKDMWYILDVLQENVAYIWIDSKDSERFIKIVETEEGEKKIKVLEFTVDAKLGGYRITSAPFVKDVLREQGIIIKEIEGEVPLAGISITTRISSNGRMLFYIPSSIIPTTGDIYDIGERFYNKLLRDVKT
jgi:hypothetical protein